MPILEQRWDLVAWSGAIPASSDNLSEGQGQPQPAVYITSLRAQPLGKPELHR